MSQSGFTLVFFKPAPSQPGCEMFVFDCFFDSLMAYALKLEQTSKFFPVCFEI